MTAAAPSLVVTCAVLFVLSLALYLLTAAKRHRLDAALAARARKLNKPAPAEPERRASYDQDDLIAFIEDARAEEIAPSRTALDYYARSILGWDIWFAVAFAAFIVAANVLAADLLAAWPWASRACLIFACMGALYGIADVAEDLTLRKIFRQAEVIAARQKLLQVEEAAGADIAPEEPADEEPEAEETGAEATAAKEAAAEEAAAGETGAEELTAEETAADEAADEEAAAEEAAAKKAALKDAAPADAAQTDAANALTRLKMVSITTSVIGVLVFFLIFVPVDWIVSKVVAAARGHVSG